MRNYITQKLSSFKPKGRLQNLLDLALANAVSITENRRLDKFLDLTPLPPNVQTLTLHQSLSRGVSMLQISPESCYIQPHILASQVNTMQCGPISTSNRTRVCYQDVIFPIFLSQGALLGLDFVLHVLQFHPLCQVLKVGPGEPLAPQGYYLDERGTWPEEEGVCEGGPMDTHQGVATVDQPVHITEVSVDRWLKHHHFKPLLLSHLYHIVLVQYDSSDWPFAAHQHKPRPALDFGRWPHKALAISLLQRSSKIKEGLVMWYQSWVYGHRPMRYEAHGNGCKAMCVGLIVKVDDPVPRELRKHRLVFAIPPFAIFSYD